LIADFASLKKVIADARQQKQVSINLGKIEINEPVKKTTEEPPAEQLSLF
jgi:hypothetical protein